MSTGHERDTVGDMCNSEGIPWPKIFFTRKMAYAPGEHFVYNSGGTYMLSEVISRATGKSLFQWLKEKLFEPLGITDVSWDVNGKVNTGAWGLLIAPRDLCKVGALYLNKGLWNGQRLLSEEWIDEATAPHVPTLGQGCAGWGQRYGYQIWENSSALPGGRRFWSVYYGVSTKGHGHRHHSGRNRRHPGLPSGGTIPACELDRSPKGAGMLGPMSICKRYSANGKPLLCMSQAPPICRPCCRTRYTS